MTTKLVYIDTVDHKYSAFEGKKKVASTQFTRPLDAGEVECMRVNPNAFLGNVEFVDDDPEVA